MQIASAGNRTRVTSMATMYSTTRPLMLMQNAKRVPHFISQTTASKRCRPPSIRPSVSAHVCPLVPSSLSLSLSSRPFCHGRRRATENMGPCALKPCAPRLLDAPSASRGSTNPARAPSVCALDGIALPALGSPTALRAKRGPLPAQRAPSSNVRRETERGITNYGMHRASLVS